MSGEVTHIVAEVEHKVHSQVTPRGIFSISDNALMLKVIILGRSWFFFSVYESRSSGSWRDATIGPCRCARTGWRPASPNRDSSTAHASHTCLHNNHLCVFYLKVSAINEFTRQCLSEYTCRTFHVCGRTAPGCLQLSESDWWRLTSSAYNDKNVFCFGLAVAPTDILHKGFSDFH